ncbi:hypothetical protein NESM_000564500 [Novymonas esmeraldas]|uniref:Cilia- and flagella-associated protein 418 n=1 Tax=Novymonas esmeraldas TaxID=1808958 RepID=A0AAW0ERE9_9TRYP
MSISELDSLIDELFPDKKGSVGDGPGSSFSASGAAAAAGPSRRRSEWDDESDNDQESRAGAVVAGQVPPHPLPGSASCSSAAQRTTSAPSCAGTRRPTGHSFDDDDDDGADVDRGHSAALQQSSKSRGCDGLTSPSLGSATKVVRFPVPFPSLADSDGAFACASRCYLTTAGATFPSSGGGGGHPSLQQLRAIAADEQAHAGSSRIQAMLRKGAFHAAIAKLGNGCLDHHGDFTSDGGCPHILCRHCNYMVVRLQDAAWDDGDGRVNLYLTLRNYYPDWCRLACATPVGVEDGVDGARPVLRAVLPAATAAAYCCQCSWVTVRSPKAAIETRLSHVVSAKEGEHPFATELPLPPGEKRRPPLWVCHGHPR